MSDIISNVLTTQLSYLYEEDHHAASFIHNLSGDTHIAHYSIYPFLHHQLILYEEIMNEPEIHMMMMMIDMMMDMMIQR